ncbi:MAG: uracil-DNA glycosylase [Actinobacteria bacterium]|nr:uracil-DNA glycosylase [Actinomycetota bacterium]
MGNWNSLKDVYNEALNCKKCPLHNGRTNVVFGTGSEKADIMFIGEAPGYYEDIQGEPFVGAAGKLLNKLLNSAELKREQVYIANIIKCRPPKNRDPLAEEIDICKDYLYAQIDFINPQLICTLGNFATKLILKKNVGITSVRGKLFKVGGRLVLPIYHPAAALYTPSYLPSLEEDFITMKKVIEKEIKIHIEDEMESKEQLGLF